MSEPAPPGTPPGRKPLSTGTKLAIGCGAVVLLVALAGGVALAVGGFALQRVVGSALEGVEGQTEATETLARLREDHPFDPPADGAVTEAQLDRFLAVTSDAWESMEPWGEEIAALAAREQDRDQPSIGDMVGGARAMGGFARARLQLADALDAHDTSLGEYAWVGLNLARALEVPTDAEPPSGVPAPNVSLARAHRERLPSLGNADGEAGPGLVLAVATIFGMTEGATWQALGLDTLGRAVR